METTDTTENEDSFTSQICSQVPCTTETGVCASNTTQCCYREATSRDVTINCPPYNPLTFSQPQVCACMSCDDINIDVIVTVVSSTDGSALMGAVVEYNGTTDIMTDSLSMFTITRPIRYAFVVREPNHMPAEHIIPV